MLAEATSAGCGHVAVLGAVGVGGSLTSPGKGSARWARSMWTLTPVARTNGLAGVPPPPLHGASGEGPGHAQGGGQGPRTGVARLAGGSLVLGSGGRVPLAEG